MNQALATRPDDGTLEQLRAVKNALAPDLSDQELQLFAMVAHRSGLDPFAKQIYAIKRQGRVTFQTGIDGYRSIAARTGEYDGQDEPAFGPVCGCKELPAGHPEFATVHVYRKGMSRPVAATAHWHEYVPQQDNQAHMWRRMPRVMLAKVAEALALRKAFPWDPNRGIGIGADLYTADEMAQADRGKGAATAAPVTAAARVAERRAAIAAPQEAPQTSAAVEPDTDAAPTEGEAADIVEGEVSEIPEGMTQEQFFAALAEAGIAREFAAQRAKAMWPDRPPRTALTPAQRAALLADLTTTAAL